MNIERIVYRVLGIIFILLKCLGKSYPNILFDTVATMIPYGIIISKRNNYWWYLVLEALIMSLIAASFFINDYKLSDLVFKIGLGFMPLYILFVFVMDTQGYKFWKHSRLDDMC